MKLKPYQQFRRNLILILCFFISYAINGQEPPTYSPYTCIYNHLFYLQDDSYQPHLSANSFSESIDSLERRKLAIQLKQIFDGRGLFIRLERLPTEATFYDSLLNEASFSPFPKVLPEVYVVKNQNGWYYSDETAVMIDQLHSSIYPFGSEHLVNLLPNKGSYKILGLYVWQYLGFGILILGAIIIFFLLKLLFGFLLRKRNKNLKTWNQVKTLSSLWIMLKILGKFLPVLLLPVKVMENLSVLLNLITSLLLLFVFLKIAKIILSYLDEFTKSTESKMDEQLLPLLRRSVQFVIIALWALHFLTLLGINVTALVAGISIGGLAIALAAQDTLKNLFGSITIFLDKPFQIGDAIVAGDVEGTVEEVGFRSTRVRSFTNSLIYVPNSKLSDTTINNNGLRQFRRYKTTIGITYDTPPSKIEEFVKGLRHLVDNHPKTRKDAYEIHLNDLGASAIEILFYIFFAVDNWTEELESKHSLLMSILNLAEELGVSFAFPSTSVYLEGSPLEKS